MTPDVRATAPRSGAGDSGAASSKHIKALERAGLVSRTILGRDHLLAAWTDPLLMANWLAPNGYAEAEVDLRLGGRFSVIMIGDDIRLEHTGEYLVIDPPNRLVFTWSSPYTGRHPSQVDISLAASGDKLLTLTHHELPDETRSSHEVGWVRVLARCAAMLAATTSATQTPQEDAVR
jgi:uncharacterized protein YndB with AHSA1/START domain